MLSNIDKAICVETYFSTKSFSQTHLLLINKLGLGPQEVSPGTEQRHHQQMGEGIQRWEAIPQEAGQRQTSQSPFRRVHPTGGAARLGGAVRSCGRLQSFWEELQTISDDIQQEWFQQDGSTPHTAAASRLWLQERFPGRVISRRKRFSGRRTRQT